MTGSWLVDVVFWAFAATAVISAYLVFRVDSMVRAAFWLLGSFLAVGAILVLLEARFLGLVLLLMMAGEMTIMAVFMVMFMMNPAGLNPMTMVHQHRTAVVAGAASFLALAGVGLFVRFPDRPVSAEGATQATADLGTELLGDSMLIFETAGVSLLAAMIGAIALASRNGRFGDAYGSSGPPELGDVKGVPATDSPAAAEDAEMVGHSGMDASAMDGTAMDGTARDGTAVDGARMDHG